ncbi:hypothetical protein DY000_02031242 [Brassica cretica]|uniref:Uncharacterized protein n=1 Tax=Brassica cretica TaxID=69181 RepID=A0ABQ7DLI6_BRACR|nr:hypothetical protein DY000_02031242 [Brassica cretica]
MALRDHDDLSQATPREIELHTQLDTLQSQLTELQKVLGTAWENPEILSEVQNLKEMLDEHTMQLGQCVEKLSQLEAENLILRNENQALHTTSNKRHRFGTQVRSMQSLDTPMDDADGGQRPQPKKGENTNDTGSSHGYRFRDGRRGRSTRGNEDVECCCHRLPRANILREIRSHPFHGRKTSWGSSSHPKDQP